MCNQDLLDLNSTSSLLIGVYERSAACCTAGDPCPSNHQANLGLFDRAVSHPVGAAAPPVTFCDWVWRHLVRGDALQLAGIASLVDGLVDARRSLLSVELDAGVEQQRMAHVRKDVSTLDKYLGYVCIHRIATNCARRGLMENHKAMSSI